MQVVLQRDLDEEIRLIFQIYVIIDLLCHIGIPDADICYFVLSHLELSIRKCSEHVSGAD
jgi:hypothetical protein